jgi:hypothetical protein
MRYALFFLIFFTTKASADNFVVCVPSYVDVVVGNVEDWRDGDTYIRLTESGDLVEYKSSLCLQETVPPMLSETGITIGCQDNYGLYKWILNINRITGEYTKMALQDPTGAIFTVVGQCELQTSPKF